MRRPVLAAAAFFSIAAAGPSEAEAPAFTIVAIGASNTSGWGVGERAAYPARLEALLKAGGHDVQVLNAGVPFETTHGMLARIDGAVPDGALVVIIQPGGNDLRFFGTRERRTANIDRMVERVRARGMRPIVYDPVFAPDDYQWDRIHLTAEAHGRIARDLMPQVASVLDEGKPGPATARVRPPGRDRTRGEPAGRP